MRTNDDLPSLPAPTPTPGFYDIAQRKACVYTADHLQAYAREAVAADRSNRAVPEDWPDVVSKALRRAYSLGQTYWQQADSESYSQNKKADETERRFQSLLDDIHAAMLAAAPLPKEQI